LGQETTPSVADVDLDRIWEQVGPAPSGRLNGRLTAVRGIWAALDTQGHRHLLVAIGDDAPRKLTTTRGLSATVAELEVGGEPPARYIDLSATEPELSSTFSAVAREIVNAVDAAPHGAASAVAAVLDRWHWFWGVARDGMTTEEELGLLGELWFLRRWLGLPTAIGMWVGPTGARHDFRTATTSVESKCTQVRSDGPARHRIANLDQLEEPQTGSLFLFSLRVVSDDLAANSLANTVTQAIADCSADETASMKLRQRLGEAGWSPAQADRYRRTWRVIGEDLYEIRAGFPRLTRGTFEPDGVPPGVEAISYSIDLAACANYLVATNPALGITFLNANK
jgi:hypothetical protein